jgi:hypothetical protein
MYSLLKILSFIKRLFRKKSHFSIDAELYREIEKICIKYRLLPSFLIESLIRQYLQGRTTAIGLNHYREMMVEPLRKQPKVEVNLVDYGFNLKHTGFYKTASFIIAVDREKRILYFESSKRYPILEEIDRAIRNIFEDEIKDKKVSFNMNIKLEKSYFSLRKILVKLEIK